MRTETVICDRCKRNVADVPPVERHSGLVVHSMRMALGHDDGRDLCPSCCAALIRWIDKDSTP